MTDAVVALGSNLGDRLNYLQQGIDGLQNINGVTIKHVSSVYETEATGGPDNQQDYLNAVALVSTLLKPTELLESLHSVENDAGRVRAVHHGPRTLDLDIIDVEGYSSEDVTLTIPHPRAHERAFVLRPLHEIAPQWQLNGTVLVSDLLNNVSDQVVEIRPTMKLHVS